MTDAAAPDTPPAAASPSAVRAAPASRPTRLVRWKVVGAVVVVAGIAADLVSKADMQERLGLDPGQMGSTRTIDVVPGFFRFQGTWNPGITFGLAPGHTQEIKTFTMLACAGLLGWLLFSRSRSRLFHVALSMILAGAVGNLYDRWQWNKVRDFLDVYWKDHHWPAFNVADSLIVVGVALVLWHEIFGRRRAAAPSAVP